MACMWKLESNCQALPSEPFSLLAFFLFYFCNSFIVTKEAMQLKKRHSLGAL